MQPSHALVEALRLGGLEQARALFASLSDAERAHPAVAVRLARTLLQRHEHGETAELLKEIRSLVTDGDVASLVALEARARHHLDEVATAKALLGTLDEAPTTSAAACREIARTWRVMQVLAPAIAWLTRACALEPADPRSWEALATCLEAHGDLSRARQIAEATAARFGPTPGVQRLLARLAGPPAELATVG